MGYWQTRLFMVWCCSMTDSPAWHTLSGVYNHQLQPVGPGGSAGQFLRMGRMRKRLENKQNNEVMEWGLPALQRLGDLPTGDQRFFRARTDDGKFGTASRTEHGVRLTFKLYLAVTWPYLVSASGSFDSPWYVQSVAFHSEEAETTRRKRVRRFRFLRTF